MSDLSRVEQLLRNALGEDIYEVTPQSRVEELLVQLNELIEGMGGGSVSPEDIATAVAAYLDEHLTNPTSPPVDTSLAIAGAAADAKKVGNEISDLKEDLEESENELKSALDHTQNALYTEIDTNSIDSMFVRKAVDELKYKEKKYINTLYETAIPNVSYPYSFLEKIYGKSIVTNGSFKQNTISNIKSYNANGVVIDTIDVSNCIGNYCEGYGLGIDETICNYIDFSNKKYHKKLDVVDLGSLNWIYLNGKFHAKLGAHKQYENYQTPILQCTKYSAKTILQVVNKKSVGITLGSNGYWGKDEVAVYDDSYSDAAVFKQAMDGEKLCYELETEEVISLLPIRDYIIVEPKGKIVFENNDNVPTPHVLTHFISINTVAISEYDEVCDDYPDGQKTTFHFKHPIKNSESLFVYKNGIKLFLGRDYTCNYKNKYIVLEEAPRQGDIIGFHYSNSIEISEISEKMIVDSTYLAFKKNDDGSDSSFIFKVNTGGYNTYQWMENATDPDGTTDPVLSLVSKGATDKSRCEIELHNDFEADEIDAYVDLYLPSESLQCLANYPDSITWFTVQETWSPFGDYSTTVNNPGARQTLNIAKRQNDTKLYFTLTCQNRHVESSLETYTTTGHYDDTISKNFELPFDKWITLHTKLTNAYRGKYYLSATVDGVETVIFDEDAPTQNTDLSDYPYANESCFTHNCAFLKMYLSKGLHDYIIENSLIGEVRTYWKNAKIIYGRQKR